MTNRLQTVVATLALGLLAQPATSQVPGAERYAHVVASTHARQTVTALVLRIPAGSAQDEGGLGGTAWLLGDLLARRADAATGPAASVSAEVTRDATIFTVLSLPDAWPEVWDRVEPIIFGAPAPGEDFAMLRESLLAGLAFDAGSPVRDFEVEAARLVASPADPWARPVHGSLATVANISAASLQIFAGSYYNAGTATLSIVGPDDKIPPTAPRPAAPFPHIQQRPGPAWTDADRFELIQDITNTWLAVAWPVAPGLGRTSLEFFVHLLTEQLDPTPPDPDRFSVDVSIEETPTGPVVLVAAAVFPEAADRWEARILSAHETLAGKTMDDDFLGWRRRRFRTARLLAESRPEEEAARMAEDLIRDGTIRSLSLEIWDLQGADLLTAAQALGAPRILRLGPDLGLSRQETPGLR